LLQQQSCAACREEVVALNGNRQALIDITQQSPEAVSAHDRAAWMSLFARYNMIEDPVGSRPHHSGGFDVVSGVRGNGPLGRFYDTYIAPNQIIFHVVRDVVCGNNVVRDLHLEINMSDEVGIKVPMHALYEMIDQGGEFKIVRLAAHWELLEMVKQLSGAGMAAVPVLASLSWRMLSIQGPSGILGFMRGLGGVGAGGKSAVEKFVKSLNNQQHSAVKLLFSASNQGVEFPHDEASLTPSEFTEQFSGQLTVNKLLSAGYVTSCSFELAQEGGKKCGVAFFEFNAKNRKIDTVKFYWDACKRAIATE
jgi:hypothetical protein